MNKKINSHQFLNCTKLKKRRGVAEIIGTLMLMAITVVGAGILSYFVNESFVSGSMAYDAPIDHSKKIKLIAYDTRDSSELMEITELNNKEDQKLLGVGALNVNSRPINDGTEFIVIQITNEGINSIFLHSLQLNYVMHVWDFQTSGDPLDLTMDLPGGNYPSDGTFSILKENSTIQSITNEVQSGQTVNVLIKLAPTVDDISLNKATTIALNVGANQNVLFLIESGNAI